MTKIIRVEEVKKMTERYEEKEVKKKMDWKNNESIMVRYNEALDDMSFEINKDIVSLMFKGENSFKYEISFSENKILRELQQNVYGYCLISEISRMYDTEVLYDDMRTELTSELMKGIKDAGWKVEMIENTYGTSDLEITLYGYGR